MGEKHLASIQVREVFGSFIILTHNCVWIACSREVLIGLQLVMVFIDKFKMPGFRIPRLHAQEVSRTFCQPTVHATLRSAPG